MALFFFTARTVIEVLADDALVSDTLDRSNSTSITFNKIMDFWFCRVDLFIISCILLPNIFRTHLHSNDFFVLLAHLFFNKFLQLFFWEFASFFVLFLHLFLLLTILLIPFLVFFITRRVRSCIRTTWIAFILTWFERLVLFVSLFLTTTNLIDGSFHKWSTEWVNMIILFF